MAFNNTDAFLVNRGGTDYKTDYAALLTAFNVDLNFITEAEAVTIVNNILAGKNPDGTDNIGAQKYVREGDNISVLSNDQGYLQEAPKDGEQYVRQNGAWAATDISGDLATLEASLQAEIAAGDTTVQGNVDVVNGRLDALVLNDLTDCSVVTPANDTILTYSNGKWVALPNPFVEQEVKFKGTIDVSTENAPTAVAGDTYIQHRTDETAGTAGGSWTGFAGEGVVEGQYVMKGADSAWHKGASIEDVSQVQSDWNITDQTSGAYIKNKIDPYTKAEVDGGFLAQDISNLPTLS